jgi:hypothetical protein
MSDNQKTPQSKKPVRLKPMLTFLLCILTFCCCICCSCLYCLCICCSGVLFCCVLFIVFLFECVVNSCNVCYLSAVSYCGTTVTGLKPNCSGQTSLLQTQGSRVRVPALQDFLSSSGSAMGSTQPLRG